MMGGLGWFGVVLETLDMPGLGLVYAGLGWFNALKTDERW